MALQRRFRFYFVFCVVILSTFGLSSFYRCLVCRRFIDIWFVIVLSTFGLSSLYLRGVVHRIVTVFYLCGSDSDRQDRFDQ